MLREFRMDDCEEVFELWKRAGLEIRPGDERDEIARKVARDPELFLVVVEEGRIVGAVMGAWDGRRGWLHRLAVDPSWQKKGVGSRLVGEVLARMRGKG